MAVELAKVSLWINSAVENKPLNFLDHRIKQGNSLIGATQDAVSQGITQDAFETSKGRDWHEGNKIRKRARKENKKIRDGNDVQAELDWNWKKQDEYLTVAEKLDQINEESVDDYRHKEEIYTRLQESKKLKKQKLIYDIWTSAFFWPLDGSTSEYPTSKIIEQAKRDQPDFTAIDNTSYEELDGLEALYKRAQKISEEESFFHWELEFPEVFNKNPGFDCVLGNPPWEELRADESEYFAVRAPEIAGAPKSERSDLIKRLETENPDLYEDWQKHNKSLSRRKQFLNNSPTISEGAVGKTNTYPLFTYHNSQIINSDGRAGFVIKTAIATDHDFSDLFGNLVKEGRIVSLYDFKNKNNIFPIEGRLRFCLLTIRGEDKPEENIEFIFNLEKIEEIQKESPITLSLSELEKISAGTFQIPSIDSNADLKLLQQISSNESNVVLRENNSDWDMFWGIMFDSGKVQDHAFIREDLPKKETYGIYESTPDGEDLVGLYEGRYIGFFDHRRRTFEDVPKDNRFGQSEGATVSESKKTDPEYDIEPRYWVKEKKVDQFLENHEWYFDWFFVYGRYTRASDSRTFAGSFIPRSGCSSSAPILVPTQYDNEKDAIEKTLVFAAVSNSHIFDYMIRNNMTGTTIGKNLALRMMFPKYSHISDHNELHEKLVNMSFELSYTSNSLQEIAEVYDYHCEPTYGTSESRSDRLCEIDAIVAYIYGLERDDLEYILDTFSTQKENEVENKGHYHTKQQILNKFDDYQRGDEK
jgi:hypothetical protein